MMLLNWQQGYVVKATKQGTRYRASILSLRRLHGTGCTAVVGLQCEASLLVAGWFAFLTAAQ